MENNILSTRKHIRKVDGSSTGRNERPEAILLLYEYHRKLRIKLFAHLLREVDDKKEKQNTSSY